jgi:hypothetical protein
MLQKQNKPRLTALRVYQDQHWATELTPAASYHYHEAEAQAHEIEGQRSNFTRDVDEDAK